MNDPLTVPARDGIEAQNGLNDIFPGDPYPVRDQLKRGLDALRAKASRGKITSAEVFNLTDPLMDILSRCEAQPEAQAVPERWKPINTAPRDGRWVWLWNKHASSGYEAQRVRWSTHYSVFGLGGCWTDGYGSTMGDGVDFDFWRETLPADFVPPASPATGGA